MKQKMVKKLLTKLYKNMKIVNKKQTFLFILKYRLMNSNIPYETIVPSVIKKGATGKGNADKDKMYEAFCKDTKTDLKKVFDTEKVGNPISDIVDSFYIAKLGYENINSK